MTTIQSNLQAVRERIRAAAQRFARNPDDVKLLAVSKTFAADTVRAAAAAGQLSFGENYVQEGVAKRLALQDLPLEWHFIGPIQSNKSRLVAENFAWAHAVDRLKLAQRLSDQRPLALGPLSVCIQVNVSGELSKHGVAPDEVEALALAVTSLPNLRLRGLMCIPEPSPDEAVLRARFRVMRELMSRLQARGLALDTLSMGMSDDLEWAIAEGSTLVRVGSAIFGRRPQRNQQDLEQQEDSAS